MNQKYKIPTYVVNLQHRTDRREHTIHEFAGREEFVQKEAASCNRTAP
jgi:hypothetical protein